MRELTSKDKTKFYHSQHTDEFSGCVEWCASLDAYGYGVFYANGTSYKAHRLAWKLAFSDPEHLFVCHHCDNPSCVNPHHLFLGTAGENNQDRHLKGRSRNRPTPGISHNMVKLSEADVLSIRASQEKGVDLASHYGVSTATICNIRKRKTWQHL